MNLPTFLILGAGKAGTTSLYYYLSQHPQIFMSTPKEPPFFQIEYERGPTYYWDAYFSGYRGQNQAGEAAHHNLHLPYVTPRIAATVPDARLMVICRDPVERALSAYWHNVTRGAERSSFEDAIDKNLRRLETGPWFNDELEAKLYETAVKSRGTKEFTYTSYVDSGYYAVHIERYAATFGQERIKVLFFDDLTRDPQGTTAQAFRFLALEPIEIRDSKAQNQPMAPGLAKLVSKIAEIPAVRRVPLAWRARIRRGLGVAFKSSKPKLNPAMRQMLADHYRPHNARLAALTGRNLDHWN